MTTKTLLITGASGGIGSEIARHAIKNFNVVLCYNKNEKKAIQLLKELKKSGGAISCQADLTNSSEVARVFKDARAHFGKVDMLVNCAGIAEQKLFTDISDEDWKKMISVNLDSAFYCCREALPQMISKKSGKIVNITSMWGEVGASMEVHYSVSKAALIGLTKALAKEVALSGITVNAVSCGAIDTNMLNNLSKEAVELVKEETPLQRLGTPSDVAEAVMFLLNDSGNFITGQVLSVNGGFVI